MYKQRWVIAQARVNKKEKAWTGGNSSKASRSTQFDSRHTASNRKQTTELESIQDQVIRATRRRK